MCSTVYQTYSGMSITEQFLKGKYDNAELCEDGIFCGERFIAVIDGVTSKSTRRYDGKTSGKYATEILLAEFARLDQVQKSSLMSPVQVLKALDFALHNAVAEPERSQIQDFPRAAVIYFDITTDVIVSYGDCKCRIGNAVYNNEKEIDVILAEKRSFILTERLNAGASVKQLRQSDPGRESITKDLLRQYLYENNPMEINGYPVINGCGIIPSMIRSFPVSSDSPVTLCSDGYPIVGVSLEESERILQAILIQDPLLIGKNDLLFKSTKGLAIGAVSFDDRAWIKFRHKSFDH